MLEIKQNIKIEGGCPRCGDSIQQHELLVNDHGREYKIFPAWCPDCKSIVAIARPKFDPGTGKLGEYIIENLVIEDNGEPEIRTSYESAICKTCGKDFFNFYNFPTDSYTTFTECPECRLRKTGYYESEIILPIGLTLELQEFVERLYDVNPDYELIISDGPIEHKISEKIQQEVLKHSK